MKKKQLQEEIKQLEIYISMWRDWDNHIMESGGIVRVLGRFEELREYLISNNIYSSDDSNDPINKCFEHSSPANFSSIGGELFYMEFGQHYSAAYTSLNRKLATMKQRLKNINTLDDEPIAGIENQDDHINIIIRLIERFPIIARQLRDRREGRPTLEIEDEYDVQDLLHALLKLYFDDIRPEEWTPSYAGSSARMDFFLKDEELVIEVKKTSKGLSGKEIGKQLIVDIAQYKQYPNCKVLFCFIDDPENRIGNPIGLENDLSRPDEEFNVIVIVSPK